MLTKISFSQKSDTIFNKVEFATYFGYK